MSNDHLGGLSDDEYEHIEQAADQFETALRDGHQPRIEDFVTPGVVQLATTVELILVEMEFRHTNGEELTVDEYLARFPELAKDRSAVTVLSANVPRVTADTVNAGDVISQRYRLVRRIGQGGFGVVWKATDTKLNRPVAVKFMRPQSSPFDSAGKERFRREALAVAAIEDRPSEIINVTDVDWHGERPFIISDFIDGTDLARFAAERSLSHREASRLCSRLAAAMQAAHDSGVVHRDLKPANILMTTDGDPRIADFGLAKIGEAETMTLDGTKMGTAGYMSPEQAVGASHEADARSDVYSLGVILFELVTGQRPFQGTTDYIIHQLTHDDAPKARQVRRSVPRDLETICEKCLHRESGLRYGTARELHEDLERYLNSEAITARPLGRVRRTVRWAKRNKGAAAALGIFFAASVVLSFMFVHQVELQRQTKRARDDANDRRKAAVKARNDAKTAQREAEDARDNSDEERRLATGFNSLATDTVESTAAIWQLVRANDPILGNVIRARFEKELKEEYDNLLVRLLDMRGQLPETLDDKELRRIHYQIDVLRFRAQIESLSSSNLLARDTYVQAIDRCRRVLAVQTDNEPLTRRLAECLFQLGKIDRLNGDHEASLGRFEEAESLLEAIANERSATGRRFATQLEYYRILALSDLNRIASPFDFAKELIDDMRARADENLLSLSERELLAEILTTIANSYLDEKAAVAKWTDIFKPPESNKLTEKHKRALSLLEEAVAIRRELERGTSKSIIHRLDRIEAEATYARALLYLPRASFLERCHESLDSFNRIVAELREITKGEFNHPRTRLALRSVLIGRAQLLDQMDRFATSTDDWLAALLIKDVSSHTRADLYGGVEAHLLILQGGAPTLNLEETLQAARLFARYSQFIQSGPLAVDAGLQKKSRASARTAVQFLRWAMEKEDGRAIRNDLLTNHEWDWLRSHPSFRALIRGIEADALIDQRAPVD